MKILVAPALLITLMIVASANEQSLRLNMQNVSLRILLSAYTEKAGKSVELVEDLDRNAQGTFFTIEDNGPLTLFEYLSLIENELKQANIGLFSISSNRLVATWIEIPNPKTGSKTGDHIRREERLKRIRESLPQLETSNH